jgi:uncharacterized protein YjbJ (UPF0337 family)
VSDASRDRIEGTVDDVTGQAQATWGDLTGDRQAETEGHMDQAEGGLKQGLADVKDRVDVVVKQVTDR